MSSSYEQAIAVIGLGARMPGAESAAAFYENIRNRVYAISDVPPDRWDPSLYYDPDPSAPDKTYSRIGGFLAPFKPPLRKFRIPPNVARNLDPTQILALDVTYQALADAGLLERDFDRSRCAVILGNSMGGDLRDHTASRLAFALFERELRGSGAFEHLSPELQESLLQELRERAEALHPPITEDTMAGELANVVAGRVAAAFRLTGPNFTVDAACAASLAAVSAAVRALRAGECDLAITGGVDRNMSVNSFIKFCKTHALSGRKSAPFDASADGFVMGEGGGVLVLKRLADAEADGDRIRAVIRGVGASSDGGARGITAPNPDGQVAALRRAYADAQVDPRTVGLIEAHGTATPVGDAAEVETLCRLLGDRDPGAEPVAVGSVKSNIGHLKSGAGAASLVKAVCALEAAELPPSLNFETPNPALRRDRLPIRVQTELAPWQRQGDTPRRAGVSAFGFGGTNFHVVLEEAGALRPERTLVPVGGDDVGAATPSAGTQAAHAGTQPVASTPETANAESPTEFSSQPPTEESPMHAPETHAAPQPTPIAPTAAPAAEPVSVGLPEVALFRLGAATKRGLRQALAGLIAEIESGTPLADLARRYGRPMHQHAERAALCAANVDELLAAARQLATYLDTGKGRLRLAGAGTFLGSGPAGRTAFLFPGQGSQYVGMLGDLADALPEVRATFEEADAAMADLLDAPLSAYILGTHGTGLDGGARAGASAAAAALQQTTVTQPAMLTADLALLRVLATLGVTPDEVAGHSLGEYAAAVAAGVLPFREALRVVAARGREMAGAVPDGADPGRMAVVAAPAEALAPLLDRVPGYVVAANKNSPHQTVIAGETAAVEQALALATEQGLQGMVIPVSHAFHSRVVAAASEPLGRILARSGVRAPQIPIYSNVTAERYPERPEEIVALLARQVASPVEFIAIIEAMYASGVRTFVEVGPKKALAGFVRDILSDRPHRVTHTNHPKKGGPRSLTEALALLAADGQPIGATHLWAGEDRALPVAVAHAPVADAAAAPTAPTDSTVASPTSVAGAPAVASTGAPGAAPRAGSSRPAQEVDAAAAPVWITGLSAGLPGRERLFSDDGLGALLRGEVLLDRLDEQVQRRVVNQHIERVVKSADGTGTLTPVREPDEVMAWAGRAGDVPLVEDYRVRPEWDRDRDPTTRFAVAAAFEALRDAWLPLVEERRAISGGRSLSEGFRLPAEIGRRTGVIFASAFPGYERLLDLVARRDRGEPFPRNTLLQILGLGHAHVAEQTGALGPNIHMNSACASTTLAVSIARDWIQMGRCDRVIVVAADNVTSDALLPWIGGGFLALGAATTERALERAAIPFGRTRHGMIVGMGAVGLVVESAAAARARGVRPKAELLAARAANSGAHPLRLNPAHIAEEVDALVAEATERLGIDRASLARDLVFMSHETFTPARGGSAQAEVDALRRAFGPHVGDVVVVNTKGYTGHPMAAGIEDAAVVEGLWRDALPPVANLNDPDPEFGDLTFHRGGPTGRRFALRLAAGFGSQIAVNLYRRAEGGEPRVDRPVFEAFLQRVTGQQDVTPVLDGRLLRLRSPARAGDRDLPPAWADAPAAVTEPAAEPTAITEPAAETITATEPAASPHEVLALLQKVVAERTGYDLAELEPDLELEADLGIDTVKQAEIVAHLRDHYHLPQDDAFRLADYPTLEALAHYVADRMQAPAAEQTVQPTAEAEAEAETTATTEPAAAAAAEVATTSPAATDSGNLSLLPTDLGDGFSILGVTYREEPEAAPKADSPAAPAGPVLVAGGTAAAASAMAEAMGAPRALHLPLEQLLEQSESELTRALQTGLAGAPLGGAVWMAPGAEETEASPERVGTAFFRLARAVLAHAEASGAADADAPWPVPFLFTVVSPRTAAAHGAHPGLRAHAHTAAGAIAGLTRGLAREWPTSPVRVVEPHTDDPREMARALRAERALRSRAVDVRYADGARWVTGLGGTLRARPVPFGPQDVVLLTGASGGIGARLAETLRARWGVKLVLTGRLQRVSHPEAEPPSKEAVKAQLRASGARPTPKAVAAALRRWQREKDLDALLTRLEQTGEVDYVSLDLTDPSAIERLVARIHRRFGRLDAVVHAAGYQQSKQLGGKSPADYTDTFACKATAGLLLWRAVQRTFATAPRRFVSFGSVAGLLGNPGQTDYASANAALAGLGSEIRLAASGTTALTIHWTGWDDVGMTADPDIRSRLKERGMSLLPADLGMEAACRLIASDLEGEVLVAGDLGELGASELRVAEAQPAAAPARSAAPSATATPVKASLETGTGPSRAGTAATAEAATPDVVVTRHRLDPEASWLRAHAVEGTALLPAVAGLEWMAQAAAALMPGRAVLGVRGAHFHRPLKVQPGREIHAVVEAARTDRPDRIRAVLRSERVNRRGRTVTQDHFEAEIVFADGAEVPAEEAMRPPLHLGRLEETGPERAEIYEHFFHTGVFQVLEAIRRVGPAGVVAAATVTPLPLAEGGEPAGATWLAPLAVEAALQAAGFGALLNARSQVLPHAIGELRLHTIARDIQAAGRLIVRARSIDRLERESAPPVVRWNVDLLDEQGTCLASLRDLRLIERAPADPARLPATGTAAELVEIAVDELGQPDDLVLDLDAELAPAEQRRAREIRHPGRRLEWIAGRLAAKELVRRHLRDRYGIALRRAQVEVATEPGGAPLVLVPSRPGLAGLLPAISITHACGRVIAMGQAPTEAGVRVGVDLTGVENRPASFAEQWLTPGEQQMLAALPDEAARAHRLAQLWSVKEAVSKALGLGLALTTGELEVTGISADGQASLALHGDAAARMAHLGASHVVARVVDWDADAVLAWACLHLGQQEAHRAGRRAPLRERPLAGLRERPLVTPEVSSSSAE